MSAEAIQRVLRELESLPDSDQQLVLGFLAVLREHHSSAGDGSRSNRNDCLETQGKILVFTGKVAAPETDWLDLVRREREAELSELAVGKTTAG